MLFSYLYVNASERPMVGTGWQRHKNKAAVHRQNLDQTINYENPVSRCYHKATFANFFKELGTRPPPECVLKDTK